MRALPAGATAPLFRTAADGARLRRGAGVRQLRRNLARVLGPAAGERELDAATRAAMRSYARYWHEVFRLPVIGVDELRASFLVEDERRLRAAAASGAGVVLALPHMGNWDVAGAWLAATGLPFTTVAERLRPEGLYERFVAARTALGMEVLPLTDAPGQVFDLLGRRLRAGGVLALLADRDLSARGVAVRFFGEQARMPAGPAALAVRTGATLLPVTIWYPPDGTPGWRARIHPAVTDPGRGGFSTRVAAMTQAVAEVFESGVAAHPADWHMLQPVWTADTAPSAGGVTEGGAS